MINSLSMGVGSDRDCEGERERERESDKEREREIEREREKERERERERERVGERERDRGCEGVAAEGVLALHRLQRVCAFRGIGFTNPKPETVKSLPILNHRVYQS